MPEIVDITGQQFGKLTVDSIAGRDNSRHVKWKCLCECGNTCVVRSNDLRSGKQISCGCYKVELGKVLNTTHGKSHSRVFSVWAGMIQRCNNPKSKAYKYYGGRGISVCNEWSDSSSFIDWAENNGYNDNLTIERVDVNGDYTPDNCIWIPLSQQGNNTRKNRNITIDGVTMNLSAREDFMGHKRGLAKGRMQRGFSEKDAIITPKLKKQALRHITVNNKTQTVAQWSRETGIQSATIRNRIDVRGWPEAKAVTVPVGTERKRNVLLEHNGETHNITDWSRLCGLEVKTISERLARGWSIEKTLTTPVKDSQSRKEHHNTKCQAVS